MKLWYKQSSKNWNQALPLGNGRLGAMVHGKTDREIISLNEDTLWSGCPENKNPKNTKKYFLQAKELTKNQEYHKAQELIENKLTSGWSQVYLPLCDMILDFKHSGAVSEYYRSLDLTTAVANVEYISDEVKYKREMFVSAPDNVVAVKITADKPQSISFSLNFQCQLKSDIHVKDGILILKGEAPSNVQQNYPSECANHAEYSDKDDERGMLFSAMAKVNLIGGNIVYSDETITIENADSALILFNANTSFAGYNIQPFLNGKEHEKLCTKNLIRAFKKSYDTLLSSHIEDYRSYYCRINLDIGESEKAALPTDERLNIFKKDKNDPSLFTLLFQYGRYLLISASRPGSQPANLQGIWNKELFPPWSSNYTININTQMNYWPVFSCALEELHQPMVEMIKELTVTGRQTAHEVYGAKGFTAHHNTDLWRLTSPVGNHFKGMGTVAFWNVSAGWLCRHLFDHYEYTLDRQFLKDIAYPIMKEASEFLLDIITEDSDGYFIICPSNSPENNFLYKGEKCGISETATMTISITRELFKNCITGSEILDIDKDYSDKLKRILKGLYPYQIGSRGQLLEWYSEHEESEIAHRHISHLYGMYPASDITLEDTPVIAEACRVSLNHRGEDYGNWSSAWKIHQWARLHDGDTSLKLLNTMLQVVEKVETNYHGEGSGVFINMLNAHPPFQIDGNFGAASGIAEMLMQSYDNKLFILPALPSAWTKGSITGLCAKGRIKVNIWWNGASVKTELISDTDQTIMAAIMGLDFKKVILKADIPKILSQ